MTARLIRILRSPDLALLLEAYLALLFLDLGVRMLGVLPVWRLIRRQCRGREPQRPVETARLRRCVQRAAGRHLYSMKCLPQSLALAWLLARRGVTTELRFGVRQEDRALEAHAWLEHAGESLDFEPASAGRFRPLEPVHFR